MGVPVRVWPRAPIKMSVEKITYSLIKKKEINSLIEAINKTKRVGKREFRRQITKIDWQWQYKKLPSSKSFCYLAKDKKKIIGYFHVPVFKFRFNKKNYLIGNAQDVGILDNYRGKGIFKKLSSFVFKDLSKKIDLTYTFPNKFSIKNFIIKNKFNYVSELPIYFKPTILFKFINQKIKENEKIIKIKDINYQVQNLFDDFSSKHQLFLKRDKTFLNWRYNKSPKGKIKIVGLKRKNNLYSVIIYKKEVIFGINSIIILDFAYKDEVNNLSILLNNFSLDSTFKKKSNPQIIVIAGIFKDMNVFFRKNFFKLPSIFTPRKIVLLIKFFNKKIIKDFKKKSSWLITLGDWDIF
jgi:hypothetical protein